MTASQKTVLLVDDEPANRDMFRMLLEHAGYRVVLAADGMEGLDQARRHLPDVVLMDLSMPVMDGWRAMRALREDGATAPIPVLAFTARTVEVAELRRAGFRAYLPKPISPKGLLSAVALCLGAATQDPGWVDVGMVGFTAGWP